MEVRPLGRRDFLRTSATGAVCLLAGARAHAYDLNGKLRVAAIGTGGQGRGDLSEVAASPRVEIAALCDVDQSHEHFGWAVERFPNAARFADYRRLFHEPSGFDAVIISTPDHMHAPIALAAMALGKHVYCQKPLTHTVDEARHMRDAANRHGIVTQMGNQIQSLHVYRTAVKMVHDGAIGKVREVHAWQSDAIWWLSTDGRPPDSDPIPADLDWDLWLGVAPERPFKKGLYHPANWRGWQDFGSGQLGDFGCHILDPVWMALGLSTLRSVEATAPPLGEEVWAPWSQVNYQFAGTKHTTGDVLPVTWYDGQGRKPSMDHLGLPEGYELPVAGSVLVGELGTMVLPHWSDPLLFPEDAFRDYSRPVLEDLNHYTDWAHACLGDGQTSSHFDYAGRLTEAVLLGVMAIRFAGERLEWDPLVGEFPHHRDASARLCTEYRRGWKL